MRERPDAKSRVRPVSLPGPETETPWCQSALIGQSFTRGKRDVSDSPDDWSSIIPHPWGRDGIRDGWHNQDLVPSRLHDPCGQPGHSMFAGWLPGFGVLSHTGRTSGRRQPVTIPGRAGWMLSARTALAIQIPVARNAPDLIRRDGTVAATTRLWFMRD